MRVSKYSGHYATLACCTRVIGVVHGRVVRHGGKRVNGSHFMDESPTTLETLSMYLRLSESARQFPQERPASVPKHVSLP